MAGNSDCRSGGAAGTAAGDPFVSAETPGTQNAGFYPYAGNGAAAPGNRKGDLSPEKGTMDFNLETSAAGRKGRLSCRSAAPANMVSLTVKTDKDYTLLNTGDQFTELVKQLQISVKKQKAKGGK